ncbi:RNA-directed DNA polymerase, eukaryota, reverse transcriptase zinc-binding domain protein, partial [Tanacetum coccineum]
YGKRHDGVNNKWNQNNRFEYKLRKEDEGKGKEAAGNKEKNIGNTNNEQANRKNMKKKDNEKMNQEGSTSKENRNGKGVLGSNRFTLLNALIDEEELVPNIDQRKIVDEFLSRNKNANNGEMNRWNEEMKRYFRDRKELFDAVQDTEENEDVMDENYDERNNVLRNEVEGVLDLFFVILSEWKTDRVYIELKELRDLNIKKTCDNVFGNWECISNGENNNKGCKIMIGWNASLIQAWMISQSRQYIFLLIETIDKRSKFFCTMIYASNSGMERRKLWKDLEIQKVITNGIPWVILGDFNVTLKVSEHTNGSANPSSEMSEFQDCVNHIEVDDLHSEGFYYTWTKSLRNPKCRTLKKLDRIMVNEAFIDKFQQAHGVFLPYMISNHSPIIVRIPNGVQKRKGSFKFSNFITDKEEFLPTAENLRKEVKKVQKEVDMFPHDENIKEKSYQILKKYYEAIQERVHRGRIMTIRNEEGVRFENDDVAVQIVKHFEDFLGKSRPVQKLSSRNDIFLNKLNNEEDLKMAPGPDRYTSRFYKSDWSIIGKEVCTAVREFFLTGKLLDEVNATLISLIPKIPTLTKYMILDLLHVVMSSANASITNNILLSQELFRDYNRKLNIKKVSFKIDLQKADDTISWEFIKDALRVGYFKRGRGLRQGDPISLYLFTLVMKVLNLLIRKNIEENEEFKYHFFNDSLSTIMVVRI